MQRLLFDYLRRRQPNKPSPDPNNSSEAGSGVGAGNETPEMRGCLKDANPVGSLKSMELMVSPLVATIVRKFCPVPRV